MPLDYTQLRIARPHFLGGGNWILRNLNDITVVFGRNGSGKSLLLRALRDSEKQNTHYTAPERAGDIRFEPSYISQQLDGVQRASRITGNLAPYYREDVIARIQVYLAKRGLSDERPLPGSPRDIEDLIQILLPEFRLKITGGNPIFELTRVDGGQRVQSINELSSGEGQVFALALDLLTMAAIWQLEGHESRSLLVDEPDTHLHPDLQQRLAEFIVELNSKYGFRILVSTHSTTLLSALGHYGRDHTSVIYLDNSTEEQVSFSFDEALREIATCLGGHALMGPLFSAPLLLVEGDDDYRIWSQVPRHHKVRIAVIPANGEEIIAYQRSLERIFGGLRPPGLPVGFALLDGDRGKPNTSPENPQNHVPFLKLSCRESENLYLAEEVLSVLGHTWDSARAAIKAKAADFGNKRERLESVDAWNRKAGDLKDVINEVARILDPKNLVWSVRLGKCLGEKIPTGELRDFLGDEVVHALWKRPDHAAATPPS